jgi:hypothetical protein
MSLKYPISGKRSGPPPKRGPNPQVPPIKAVVGKFFAKQFAKQGEKLFPAAKKFVQDKATKLYNDFRLDMSETSAAEQTKRVIRQEFKDEPGVSFKIKTKKITEKSKGGLMDYYKDLL